MQKPWMKILLVINVGSVDKRSNQPKFQEPKMRGEHVSQNFSSVGEQLLMVVFSDKTPMRSLVK